MLGTILIKFAVSVLSYYQGRADFREAVLKEVENAGLKRLAEASKWAAGGGDATLGVRDSTKHTLP